MEEAAPDSPGGGIFGLQGFEVVSFLRRDFTRAKAVAADSSKLRHCIPHLESGASEVTEKKAGSK